MKSNKRDIALIAVHLSLPYSSVNAPAIDGFASAVGIHGAAFSLVTEEARLI